MTEKPYFIQELGLQGFRAYLEPKQFDFSKKRCLALFAPNGSGKSGVIDALEFMFSDDGTLERLGKRAINNQAGTAALEHNLAKDKKIEPNISIAFSKGQGRIEGTRKAGSGKRIRPDCAATVDSCFVVSPIIRGHELRTFVENHKPEKRYADVAGWLQLGPLVEVQKNLRSLRQQVKSAAEDMSGLENIDRLLAKETENQVACWDEAKVLQYLNDVIIKPLDSNLSLSVLDVSDAAYLEIASKAKAEEQQLGLAGLTQILDTATAIHSRTKDEDTGEDVIAGAILAFETFVGYLDDASVVEATERGKAADAAFEAVWREAEPLFAEGASSQEECPVCETKIGDTKLGSANGIREHLAEHLAGLATYAAAKSNHDKAIAAAEKKQTQLIASLTSLPALLVVGHASLKETLTAYQTLVEGWPQADLPISKPLKTALESLAVHLDKQITQIKDEQGEHTYLKAKTKIDCLINLKADHGLAEQTKSELETLNESLTAQSATISAEIRKKVQALLDLLQAPMNEIYGKIQGSKTVPIRLKLPSEEDTTQQKLDIVIDFAPNRTDVQPSGYLSDSQIHSLALALRMAAIQKFNEAAPIMALDDIVTSYDADHRRAISSLIADKFGDCQLIVTTHDERFFNYLIDQLDGNDWQFKRITRLDADFGPRFSDHKVTEEMIEELWNDGKAAANEMRQAEEEWLLRTCREFGVDIRIRSLEKAYSYDRGEMASALASFLNKRKLKPKLVEGVSNSFLISLQKGEIENFGNHFQDVPYGNASIGDEKVRWKEFCEFTSQFSCPICKRKKFKRPGGLAKPVCAHTKCEAQFEFGSQEKADT